MAERAGAARWEPAILLAVATDVLLEIQVVEVVMLFRKIRNFLAAHRPNLPSRRNFVSGSKIALQLLNVPGSLRLRHSP